MAVQTHEFRDAHSVISGKGLTDEVDVVIGRLSDAWETTTASLAAQKKVLSSLGWEVEFPIGIKNRRYAFDGYKDGIALEIEWSKSENILPDMLKFQYGFVKGTVDVGIVTSVRYPATVSPVPIEDMGGAQEIREMEMIITVPILLAVFSKGHG